jgi:hypothetical protein
MNSPEFNASGNKNEVVKNDRRLINSKFYYRLVRLYKETEQSNKAKK